jgi:Family of unknown function (DUF6134)
MTKAIRALGVVAILALGGEVQQAGASETEAREFTIEVDGKACGQYVMTITKQDSGIVSMQAVANMTLKLLIRTYRYQFEGTEHWKNGRLLQLNSKSDDDGKKNEVSAKAEPQSLRLRVNGQERNCRWDVWTTSYFQVADQRFHNQAVPLLDNDTGKEYLGQLKLLAAETLTLGGKAQTCQHFRVSGGPSQATDLWFDGEGRLVRQEFTEEGKRVVFNLQAVRR